MEFSMSWESARLPFEDRRWIAAAYGNLGLIYQGRGDLDQAEEMQRKSLAIHEQLGADLPDAGGLDQAEEMHRKALAREPEARLP